jgi:hypothetical protein
MKKVVERPGPTMVDADIMGDLVSEMRASGLVASGGGDQSS